MGLRFILGVSWSLPLALLAWIFIHEYGLPSAPVLETNTRMRVKMCHERVATAKADPNDAAARQAIEDCVMAGYITREDARITLD
jgi:hypothetical protein